MINFFKQFNLTWIDNYTLYLLEDNNKILHLNLNTSLFYEVYSIYKCIRNNNVIMIVDNTKKSIDSIVKLLNSINIEFIVNKNKILINENHIEIIPLNIITNKILQNNIIVIDVLEIKTKISDYLIYRSFINENIEHIICSIKNTKNCLFLNQLFDKTNVYKIPIIK